MDRLKTLDISLISSYSSSLRLTVIRIEDFEYEDVPKEERKYPDDDGVLGMMGSLRKVNKKWRDLNFHGVFNFYGFESGVEDWHEYDAKFTDGKLVEIKAVEEKVT